MKADKSEKQLAAFISKYMPEVETLAHDVLAKMRKQIPGAIELVYDNYNTLAIGFSPTEKASDAVLSIALYPRHINLFFLNGASLRDPQKILVGSGKRVRHVTLERSDDLDEPELQNLIRQVLDKSPFPLDKGIRGRIVIKSISAKQRPRRPRLPRQGARPGN